MTPIEVTAAYHRHQGLFEQALRAADDAARGPDREEAARLLAVAANHAAVFSALDAMVRP